MLYAFLHYLKNHRSRKQKTRRSGFLKPSTY